MSTFLKLVALALMASSSLVAASSDPLITPAAIANEEQHAFLNEPPTPIATRTLKEVTRSTQGVEPIRVYKREAVPATPSPVSYSSLPVPTPVCSMSICADYINPCGQMYGGCFLAPECGGAWPSFNPPSCSLTMTKPITTTTSTKTSSTSRCSMSICADYINACGQMYGGCFLAPECGGVWPSFTAPPCTRTTTTITSTTKTTTPTPSSCTASYTICTDRWNPCSPYDIGTCYINPKCGGQTLPPVDTKCLGTPTPITYPPIKVWGQCGGIGWTYGNVCETGLVCTKYNDWYSQCIPK